MTFIDKNTMYTIEVVSNYSLCLDDMLYHLGYTVDDDGQLMVDGNCVDAWYDDMVNIEETKYTVRTDDVEFFDSFYGDTDPDDIEEMQNNGIEYNELCRLHNEWSVEEDKIDWLNNHFVMI